ncbi:MAG: DUF456 domain-containing protein [Anaerolineales bacterium]
MDPSLIPFIEIVLVILTSLVMLVGLVGAVVPVLPGAWLIWLAALGYGLTQPLFGQPLFDGWIGGVAMAVLTLLAAADLALEYVITHSVTHKEGVSFQATLASIGLGLVGIFFFPPIGPLVGSVLGLFLVEYFRQAKDWRKALRSLRSYAKGCGWAMVAEVGLCLVMIGVWVGWVALAFVLA